MSAEIKKKPTEPKALLEKPPDKLLSASGMALLGFRSALACSSAPTQPAESAAGARSGIEVRPGHSAGGAPHGLQGRPAPPNLPAGQPTHASPTFCSGFGQTRSTQSLSLSAKGGAAGCFKEGQGKLMGAQALESVAPGTAVYVPVRQPTHAELLVAFSFVPYLPGGHWTQPDRDCPGDAE